MTQKSENQKKAYMREALAQICSGDDGISFFLRVIASSLLSFYTVRFYALDPSVGCSQVDCDCRDHYYRQSFCKHMQIAFLFFLGNHSHRGGDNLPIWQVSKLVTTQLRHCRFIDLVRIGHLTDWSLTIGLVSDVCPLPRWRIYTSQDWLEVVFPQLVEALAEVPAA